MEYKFKYKDNTERMSIVTQHNDLFLIKEQNIKDGNYLIFVDGETRNQIVEKQEINNRLSLISDYISSYIDEQDYSVLSAFEDFIIQTEVNKVTGGI